MKHYIIASHKNFASGLYSALQAIIGNSANIEVICAYVDDEDIGVKIDKCLSKFSKEDEVIVMSDIYGGSVNNEFIKRIGKYNFHLVAGVNLSLAISLIIELPEKITREKIISKVEASKESIKYCNDELLAKKNEEDF
ncbi:MAG: PTS sugar transporter subunit IIA [Anaerorhabdus sp.]